MTNDDKKSALTTLEAARLRELVDSFGVTTDKRRRDTMIDALLDAGIEMGLFLSKMTRDELKAMCRALGLSDEGREKVVLVSRLLVGRAAVAAPTEGTESGAEPAKRVLELLRREELRDAAEREGVAADRRSIGTIADALVAANVPLSHVLEHLPRTRLKEVCRTLGLDDSGREKVPLVNRLLEYAGLPPLDSAHHEAHHEDAAPEENHATNRTKLAALEGLLQGLLNIEAAENYWPAKGDLVAGDQRLGVDLYARIISGTGRNEAERRFQNPPSDGAIHLAQERPALLMGLWLEQGADRCVLVAFDAYRRASRTTRFSLFMPLTLLEQAADMGFATHITGSGETIYAFRPDNAARYMDIFTTAAPWLSAPARKKAHAASTFPPVSAVGEDSVEIRPRAGMFAAFARLNYKPWFALAELVDNAVQSHLANLSVLRNHGIGGPLVVDIVFEDDEISVTDRACGIALKDFERAFSPATPPPDPTGLSEFGLGMKASASWFAREWSVRTSALGEPVERTIAFDIPKITREGLERLPVETRPARAEDHFTVVSMRKLRVRPRGTTLGKMKEHLASIYRGLIADGTLRLRVTSSGRLEELAFEQPMLLDAPIYSDPHGQSVYWRKEFAIDLDEGRRVTGWAGVMAAGKYSRAGFSVFRRKRLIEGSVGEAYRPRAIFGTHNSFASQRIVGEMHVEGFDVTHTKDGIQWGDYEEDIAYTLYTDLNQDSLPLVDQANGYRARREAVQLSADFGEKAMGSTAAALESPELLEAVVATASLPLPEEDAPATAPHDENSTLQQRSFRMKVAGDKDWDVQLELVRDVGADWLTCTTGVTEGVEQLTIRVNLDHEFSVEHVNNNERALEPLLRFAVAVGIGERQARSQGVKSAGAILRHANELLRRGLSSATLGAVAGGCGMSNVEEVRPVATTSNGELSETVIGPSTEGLGEYLVSSGSLPSEEAFRRVRDEAVEIVRRCRPFRGPDGTRTGLVVGYVQSGKTMSMTAVSSLARDNGCRMVIMLAGVTTNLLRQNASRFRDTLRKASDGEEHWMIINSEEAKNRDQEIQMLRQAVEEWRDTGMPEESKRTLFFAVLKHHKHLEWLERVLRSESLEGIAALILDDEADQASLNVKPDDDDPSTTYARIQAVRDALPNHTYVQYTATPQAPLLINIDDMLSPAFAELVEPGTGYTGGLHFFGKDAPKHLVKTIPAEDRFKAGEPPADPPSSLLEALAVFVVGSAVARTRKKPRLRAMLVHPSARNSDQGVFHEWVNNIIKRWGSTLSDALSEDRADTLEELRKGYDELALTDSELPPFEEHLFGEIRLTLRRVQPKKINSEDATEVDWANSSDHILVGGEKLNRGYTVEGLTVTYMPRDAGGWNADTLQQRARFFGYKASYLSLCRLYLHPDVSKAFRDYVAHEQDVRSQLAEHRGKPLREWRRAFFLSSKMAPTRKNILSDPLFKFKASDEWFIQRFPHLDKVAAKDNERLVEDFSKTLNFSGKIHGQRSAELSLRDLFRDLLLEFRVPSEKAGWYAQLMYIRRKLDKEPDALACVVEMSQADGNLVRNRSPNGDAVALHQGASSKKDGGYPGDAKVLEAGIVTVQIHTVKVGTDGDPVKALAVHVPDKPSDIVSQG